MNESDLIALIAGCRTAETRVIELCDRFGTDIYEAACGALIDRTRVALARSCAAVHPRGAASPSPTGSTTTGWATARSRSC